MQFSFLVLFCLLVPSLALPVTVPEPAVRERNTPLNDFLTILLDHLPQVEGTINAVAGVLTLFEQVLATLTGQKTTYNELSGSCKPYTIVFARGTTEPGNVGILVGPPLFEALRDKLGSSNLAIQGVNKYDADIDGYLEGGDPAGSKEMAAQIQSAYTKCPNTKLVASGYSQGGQIVHNAAALLPAKVAAWISSVVIFGDPNNGKPVANVPAAKVKTYCSAADNICVNGVIILPAHLVYAVNAVDAAAFIAAH
ncbi:putative cutinase [Bisporella sp. PMI_857]|nr:putative cutinase [Bisporella sp. PMI_857]